MSLSVVGKYAKFVFGVLGEYAKLHNFDITRYFVHPDQKYFRSSIRPDGLDLANKPSHATVPVIIAHLPVSNGLYL